MDKRLRILFSKTIVCCFVFLMTSCSMNQEQGSSLSSVSEESSSENNQESYLTFYDILTSKNCDFDNPNYCLMFFGAADSISCPLDNEKAQKAANYFKSIQFPYVVDYKEFPKEIYMRDFGKGAQMFWYFPYINDSNNDEYRFSLFVFQNGMVVLDELEDDYYTNCYYTNVNCVDYNEFKEFIQEVRLGN